MTRIGIGEEGKRSILGRIVQRGEIVLRKKAATVSRTRFNYLSPGSPARFHLLRFLAVTFATQCPLLPTTTGGTVLSVSDPLSTTTRVLANHKIIYFALLRSIILSVKTIARISAAASVSLPRGLQTRDVIHLLSFHRRNAEPQLDSQQHEFQLLP